MTVIACSFKDERKCPLCSSDPNEKKKTHTNNRSDFLILEKNKINFKKVDARCK